MTDGEHALRIVFEDDRLRLTTAGNVTIAAWWGAPAVEHIEPMRIAGRELRAEYPMATGFINVVVSGVPDFSDEVRKGLASLAADAEGSSVGSAHVLLRGGMIGAAVRALLSTITLLSRSRQPVRVFGDIDGAVAWLVPLLQAKEGPRWTEAQLSAVCAAVLDPPLQP